MSPKRTVASAPRPPDEPATGEQGPATSGTQWAHALVYGTRVIDGVARIVPADEGSAVFESWTIRELDTSVVVGAPAPRCLVFESNAMVRRVWRYPADWATLPADALLRLAGIWP